jgi:hypothetical protein
MCGDKTIQQRQVVAFNKKRPANIKLLYPFGLDKLGTSLRSRLVGITFKAIQIASAAICVFCSTPH